MSERFQLIDTHAHLDYPDFESDFDEVIARAAAAGVDRIITIGTSIDSSRRAVALAEKYPAVYAVVGVHPGSALESEEDIMGALRELAQNRRVVAIGETGLDYHRLPSETLLKPTPAFLAGMPLNDPKEVTASVRDGAFKARQAELFEQQLDVAAELGLNVVIHQRDAWNETLEILRPYIAQLRCVFHCFTNSIDQARQVIDLGHLVSFTGIVTFKNARDVQEVAAQVPPDSFMVETDCPYLAPAPFRGKRCEPAHARHTAETIAILRGQSLDQIAATTTRTAEHFFRF